MTCPGYCGLFVQISFPTLALTRLLNVGWDFHCKFAIMVMVPHNQCIVVLTNGVMMAIN